MKQLTLDCRDGMSALHDQLARELNFPQWYGRNLDALYDCMTVLSEPAELTLLWPELLPGLVQVLGDAAEENLNLQLILT